MSQYARWALNLLQRSLKTRRVVVISGARQCGKTTLSKQLSLDNAIYRTLDDVTILKSALDDPKSFVTTSADILIIDEIQKAPDLLPSIKQIVDLDNRPGQFLLTGSADIRRLPQVSESLAGRIKNLHLRTLTQGEILGRNPNFIQKLFKSDIPSQIRDCNKRNILEMAFIGGYPEVLTIPPQLQSEWFADYTDALISKDLKDIVNIKRIASLRALLQSIAAWSSKFMDIPDLCGKLQISRPTFESYINALEAMYLFEKVPAWCKTDYSRIGKKEKIFISDTSLMTSILNWNIDEVILNPDRCGKLVETLVFHELIVQADLCNAKLYHYRDRENREIDFILETKNDEIACIEVKAGSSISKNDFRHMQWFKKNIANSAKTIILYSGEDTLSFGDGMLAIPLAMLWNE